MHINGTTAGVPIDFFPALNLRTQQNPYRRLAAMVLIQAIKDAVSPYSLHEGGYTREGAINFLLNDTIDFPLWCAGLGHDYLTVRSKLRCILRQHEMRKLLKEFSND